MTRFRDYDEYYDPFLPTVDYIPDAESDNESTDDYDPVRPPEDRFNKLYRIFSNLKKYCVDESLPLLDTNNSFAHFVNLINQFVPN